MIKTLVVVASGGALAFGLAGVASPAMALGSVAPAGVTQANLPMPDGTPIIRDSKARPGCGHPGQLRLWNPAAPPTIRDSNAQAAPPTIRDSKARASGAGCIKLMAPDPPIVRGSTARLGDPDDGGQLTAALGDPDDGG